MYYINKFVFAIANPLTLAMLLMLASLIAGGFSRIRRIVSVFSLVLALGVLLFFSLPSSVFLLGLPLEKDYPVTSVEETPCADAIIVLGGGMKSATNANIYADMDFGADRVYRAAMLYKTGKAPLVVLSGCAEKDSSLPLLIDFGVPEDAIIVENDSRNTEENAKLTEQILVERFKRPVRALLVTSAWHMRRSEMMFRTYAKKIEFIASPCDWEATIMMENLKENGNILPSAGALERNTAFFKEHLGYWGYKLFR